MATRGPPGLGRRRHRPADDRQLVLPLFEAEDTQHPLERWTAEEIRQLREAVLEDVLATLLKAGGRENRDDREEAWEWLLDDSIQPFSFRVCAQAAAVDPDDLRETVLRAVERIERLSEEDAERIDEALAAYWAEAGPRTKALVRSRALFPLSLRTLCPG